MISIRTCLVVGFVISTLSIITAKNESYQTKTKVKKIKGNQWEHSGFLEGDILVPNKTVGSRNGFSDEALRWPYKTVPFVISSEYTPQQREMIFKAAKEINKVTCVNIRPKLPGDQDFVKIADRNRGCSSYIGFMGNGEQEMNLADMCFDKFGTLIHEFLHCLGFFHQQSSAERDNFISIQWDNIIDGAKPNFRKYTTQESENFGVEYDVASIMHYSSYAFSKNGKRTITVKNENFYNPNIHNSVAAFNSESTDTSVMGQRDEMTEKDILKINRMYDCE